MKIKIILSAVLVFAFFVVLVFVLVNSKEKDSSLEPVTEEVYFSSEIIGKSVLGREIESFSFGRGETHIVFVGGIHGGYEWNSVVLAYEFIDYFKDNPNAIPDGISVTVIPSLNPDGVFEVVGKEGRFGLEDEKEDILSGLGRFNSRDVDLNRNFDCKWKAESSWRGNKVSAGEEAFSEPEARALRDFVLKNEPRAVIFWHSQANAVYASECEEGILPETRGIMNAYALASGYKAVDVFDAYEITGDAEGWLASIGIPAITVELKTRDSIEWKENLAGVRALFGYYGRF